jgi:GT2 family glycosyltransferase
LVSIVMPAYNAREFIDNALDDVSRQLHGNWELVVVEDGSAEDVEQIIHQFQARHTGNRVVYHRKPENDGVSSARNDAMSLCRGEFVAFLDADDRWSPDHLQRKVRLLRQSGCDLVYSRVEMFDSHSDQVMCTWGPTDEELRLFPESMFGRPYLQPSGVVVRASLLADVGKFDESLAYAEDYDYWFRAIHLGKRFYFDEKITSRYRKNHASAATTGRLVLCYDGVARVASRHLMLKGGDADSRRRTVARHFLAAGIGHLAFRPSHGNGCNPEAGRQLLHEACRLGVESRDGLKCYWLARFALATGTAEMFRGVFRRKYKRIVG